MVPDGFFDKLENVLNEIHGRGVADPDFAHSVDIIITPTGNPVVIDLASAIIYNPDERSQILRRIVFNYIANLNKKYLLKRKARFAPHLITHQELQAIKNT